MAHTKWSEAGRPDYNHPLSASRQAAKKLLRRAVRQQAARDRRNNIQELMDAKPDDSKLFHNLIRRQRDTKSTNTKELTLHNHLYSGNLLPAWDLHFSELATPSGGGGYTPHRQEQAQENVLNIAAVESSLPIKITKQEVINSIQSLKFNKAKDTYNLVAEHLKLAPDLIAEFLTPVINSILETGKVPIYLKEGLLHPVHKKGKPKIEPGNYRGITITPVIMKVIDKIILDHQKIASPSRIHPMQFGFTEGKSGLHAAFLLTESIAEAKDRGEILFCASLDVQKAFDTVQHASLLDKLHEMGVCGTWWSVKADSYKDLACRTTWEGKRSSDTIHIRQGNGQGKLTSPDDYITYLSNLLELIRKSGLGYGIGSQCIPSPTCADDMLALASNPADLQGIISLIEYYANAEHYRIHPTKSMIIPFNSKESLHHSYLTENLSVDLNGEVIPAKTELIHLGIKRDQRSATPTVEERVMLARRTLYALMGSGLHGTNGLPVSVSLHLYDTYVLSRALYGLEAISLTDSAIKDLELFHRKSLRSIIGLPERSAISALHVLSGKLPLRNILHIRILGFLWSLMNSEVTRDVIIRQYAMKKASSASWIVGIKKVLQKYNLPSIYDISCNLPSKTEWKTQVKAAVHTVANAEIAQDATQKSTLRYLNPETRLGVPHRSLEGIDNPFKVTRANIKVRVLIDVYPLQAVLYRMKLVANDLCPVCDDGSREDVDHFLASCGAYVDVRNKYMARFLPILGLDTTETVASGKLLVGLILDATHPDVETHIQLEEDRISALEDVSRDYIYAMHLKRTAIVKSKNQL